MTRPKGLLSQTRRDPRGGQRVVGSTEHDMWSSLAMASCCFYLVFVARQTHRQILAAERARGRQYDLVAKARTDNQYCDAWPSCAFDWGICLGNDRNTASSCHAGWAHDRVIDGNSAMLRTHLFTWRPQWLSCQKESDYRRIDGFIGPMLPWHLLANNRLNFDNRIKPAQAPSVYKALHLAYGVSPRTHAAAQTFSVRWIDH